MILTANQTLAQTQAQRNLSANLAAIDQTQPQLRQWVVDQLLHLEWVFGRDQSLTGIDEFGQWWAGCSLPGKAAQSMLKKLEIKGAVGCFLAPTHSAQLQVALDRLRPEQAIVAIVPDYRDLAVLLHCQDFSEAIRSHRLWLAAGPAWDVTLGDLFERHPGLATPNQFIRTPDAEPLLVQPMISTAQQIFAEASTARAAVMQTASISFPPGPRTAPRVCVVAPMRFRLWNDLGQAMISAFQGCKAIELSVFNADDPLCSSPLALVSAARQSDAILTANTGRSDLPGLIPDSIPWLTWITAGRIPSVALAGSDDHLLVVDPGLIEQAKQSGWPESRVHVAGWPAQRVIRSGPGNGLAIIVDTFPLNTPKDLLEYSSHSILWESIREELSNDPMVLRDPRSYLRQRMQRAGVGEQCFAAGQFIDRLILPAYQQGVARRLIEAGIPLRLYGTGWEQLPTFASHAGGGIQSRGHLIDVARTASGLVNVWPTDLAHPIESLGVPLISRGRGDFKTMLQLSKKALAGQLAPPALPEHPLADSILLRFLRSTSAAASDTIQ